MKHRYEIRPVDACARAREDFHADVVDVHAGQILAKAGAGSASSFA
jgi:hypothetical protein